MEPENKLEHLKSMFSQVIDPRVERTKLYPLMEIIFLCISAVVSGCQTWEEIADFGEAKQEWLSKYLPYQNGVPSHDTVNRVISLLDYRQFESCFISWAQLLIRLPDQRVINIDGKSLRGSADSYHSKAAIHLVNAWCNEVELVLGQYRTEDKSNEITAIPSLLDLLAIQGSIITIDAMGCQKEIAAKIVEHEADYVLALKANQGELFEEVEKLFDFMPTMDAEKLDKDHGRIERRCCRVINDLTWLLPTDRWPGMKAVVKIETSRELVAKGSKSSESRYYITSLERSPEFFNDLIRGHWGIENKLHWSMDVLMSEDLSRKRQHNAAANFAIIRKMGLNLLKLEPSKSISINRKMKQAAMMDQYRQKVLII